MSETYNEILWRKHEDLDKYAVAHDVPVWLGGRKVIADRVVKTCCPHNCYDTCGELVYIKDEKVIKIEGNPEHPITKGHLCLKGFANVQKINSEERVKYPLLRVGERGEGKFKRITWDEAMDYMVEKIQTIVESHSPEAVVEYFDEYPEDLVGLKDFMLDMFRDATTIAERDSVLLNRAAEMGMISRDASMYLCEIDSYLFRGMLADVRNRDLDDEDYRWVTREFMDLIIRTYTTQLEEGCSILVVNPDFVASKPDSDVDARSSYRVRFHPIVCSASKQERRKATA